MKKKVAIVFALLGWFAVVAQFILIIDHRVAPVAETIIRFFSFFTILTNTLVAVYFTSIVLSKGVTFNFLHKPGTLTAITIYISMVGLVYQVALRWIWNPEGLQRVVDELLHTLIPLMVIFFWGKYGSKDPIQYKSILKWAIYPLAYMVLILIRGSFSGFYPYPFIDVTEIGYAKTFVNSGFILMLYCILALVFISVGKKMGRKSIRVYNG